MQKLGSHIAKTTFLEKFLVGTLLVLIGAVLLILPPFLPPYSKSLLTQILIFSIFAVGVNLIVGYVGLFSLGHAAFFGVAGYTVGILILRYGVRSFWVVTPAAILLATFLAAFCGLIALRVSGLYFLFVTLALGELLHSLAWKWQTMTGGDDGLVGIPYPDLGLFASLDATRFYYMVLIFFVFCMFVLYRLIKSPFGYALQGIREDERRMQHLGYNTWLYKYIAFTVSGFFAGVAGVLFAPFASVMAPEHLGVHTSTLALLMIIIGSDRVVFGPVVGAAVVLFLQYYASIFAPQRWPMILGGVFVLSVMFLRGGITIHLLKIWKRVEHCNGSVKP